MSYQSKSLLFTNLKVRVALERWSLETVEEYLGLQSIMHIIKLGIIAVFLRVQSGNRSYTMDNVITSNEGFSDGDQHSLS